MLTVWTICWGDKYPDYFVQRLQREVRKHLDMPHRFVCITDREIEGVTCQPFADDYPGWWSKVTLFKAGVASDRNLWLDLDVVITGDLTEMVKEYAGAPLAMPLNWAQSGHGGCQSSVMIWKDNYNTRQIYDLYNPADPRLGNWPPTTANGALHGDQEWITELRDTDRIHVTPITEGIKSYKYHCRGGLPGGTKVVVFHGDPKPDKVREPWFVW